MTYEVRLECLRALEDEVMELRKENEELRFRLVTILNGSVSIND